MDVVTLALLDRLVVDETLYEDETLAEVNVVEIVGVELLDINVKCVTKPLRNRLVENET